MGFVFIIIYICYAGGAICVLSIYITLYTAPPYHQAREKPKQTNSVSSSSVMWAHTRPMLYYTHFYGVRRMRRRYTMLMFFNGNIYEKPSRLAEKKKKKPKI